MHRPVIHITAGRLLLFRNGATGWTARQISRVAGVFGTRTAAKRGGEDIEETFRI